MNHEMPLYIPILFCLTTLLTIYIFFKASRSKTFLIWIALWIVIQSVLSIKEFYTVTDTVPPRFFLLVLPAFIFITGLFFTVSGKRFLNGLDPAMLTVLHIVRIPVEIGLYALFLQNAVPGLMTFEGSNPDILSGLTAPFIYYFGYRRAQVKPVIKLIWNIACLLLLVNIVVRAVLSLPLPFQVLAQDQPAVALLYFPYILLPCCIVPLVLLSHLACIRGILRDMKEGRNDMMERKKIIVSNFGI
ncbi:MAG TPA: hypothetical protein VM101_12170 [Flavitalea sp.]|nr:hypothetical protein [Flavitalea sp.]